MNWKQAGFSLVEVVVGGAILAGIGLLGTQLMKNQKTTQQKIDHDLELEMLHTRVADFFRGNAKDCDATFRYHYNQEGPIPAPAQIRRCTGNCNAESDAQHVVGAEVVTNFNQNMGTARGLWRIDSYGTLRANQTGQSPSRTNIMLLPVNYVHEKQANRRVTKFVPIAMRFDSANRFKQCINAASTNIQNVEREVCNSLKAITTSGQTLRGMWDGDLNKCTVSLINPNGVCPEGLYLAGVERGLGTRCVRYRDNIINSKNVFNNHTMQDLVDTHEDRCNFNRPGAPNSYPRIYTNAQNRFAIRCGP